MRVAGGAPQTLGQFGAEALPLLRVEAGLCASAGTVGVVEEFGDASLAEPADPSSEGAAGGAHDLGGKFLTFHGQANGLESLALPKSALGLEIACKEVYRHLGKLGARLKMRVP